MPRILFFVFLAFLVWLAVRVLGSGRKRDTPSAPAAATSPEPIRPCAWCGVQVPVNAAVALPDGRLYCGDAHRAAAVAAATDRSQA